MQYLKERALELANIQTIAQFLILSTAATVLPFYFHVQLVTGPIVNAIFILTLFFVGIRSALVVCLVPSLMALSGGLLPVVLAPVVPFIMIGNAILILTLDWFYNNWSSKRTGYWIGVVVGSFLKFLFLYLSVDFIAKLLLKQELAVKVAQMMSWPQFATAVLGGILAYAILKPLGKLYN